MSDTDSFIDEVNEEVRRDRFYFMLKRYGWIAVLAVILLVGGAAWKWQSVPTSHRHGRYGHGELVGPTAQVLRRKRLATGARRKSFSQTPVAPGGAGLLPATVPRNPS